ncbi:amidohydrolase family protein [Conexibacter arvalis]|uniref:Amidohydrolase-related domain-containing protein n=1 Tax=Conexibacter arvalis TaxID=912552 RepID=A0A840I9P6_9ACTN|nr:hypothetical protein [Conexibacter arvalis]
MPHERTPVIDVCGILYDAPSWEAYLRTFAARTPAYLSVFAGRFAVLAGLDPRVVAETARRDPVAAAELLIAAGTLDADVRAHVEALDRDGVRAQVIAGGHAELASGDGTINDRVAALAAEAPGRLVPFAGLSLREGSDAVGELRRCVGELGMRGAAITHFLDDADPLGAASRAVYVEAEQLGVPLWIHTGHNLSSRHRPDHCTWRELDAIARDHPQLTLIAGHGGWPWVLEMVSICQRHVNVHLEISSHRPARMAIAGSGWEPLLAHGATTIRSKVLFGTMSWVHDCSIRELADEVEQLGIGDRTARRWLHDNAARVLGLPPGEAPPASARAQEAVR